MILLDKPYVSQFLAETIVKNHFPVYATSPMNELHSLGVITLSEAEALERVQDNLGEKIYSNSENTIAWLQKALPNSELVKQIGAFKNKADFRELITHLYPDFFYQKIAFHDLKHLDVNKLPLPFIIKPSVGFFSMGVYQVSRREDWPEVLKKIQKEMDAKKHLYPSAVMDSGEFIIEEWIPGDELAVDAYFNSKGEAVVLNILKHLFASDDDVSDRVYITSHDIIREYLSPLTEFLEKIGNLLSLKNFPLHLEVRITPDGKMVPIEGNPMRFAGWCTTDAAHFSYGLNPYEAYLNETKPDWNHIFKSTSPELTSIIVLDNSTGYEAGEIKHFHYEKLLKNFKEPLHLRRINYHEYPVFGFVFTRTLKSNQKELINILRSDLKEYVELVE